MRDVPTMLRRGDAYVASTATVLADVTLERDASVWYGCVVRGDDAPLSVGERTNIQDASVMHADTGVPSSIGHDVTVGHGAVLHGAMIEPYVLIGMGAVILGHSVIGEGSIVAAGCVVPERFVVPPYSLVVGVPAKIVKTFDPAQRRDDAIAHAADYVRKAKEHAAGRWSG